MYPVLLKVGPLTIRFYGVMIAVGFFIGMVLAQKEAARKGIKSEVINDLFFYLLLTGILGARIYYYLFYDPDFFKKPWLILAFWQGGLTIHGAVIGGLIAGIGYSHWKRVSFWQLADSLAPSIALGQSLGRVGCFLNGCCYGEPTTLPWGVRYTSLLSLVPDNLLGERLHPTQLYESLLCLVLFSVLWKTRKKETFEGRLFLFYLLFYSLIRFMIEFLRADSLYVWGTSFKIAQVISIIIITVVLPIFYLRRKTWRKSGLT